MSGFSHGMAISSMRKDDRINKSGRFSGDIALWMWEETRQNYQFASDALAANILNHAYPVNAHKC